MLPETLETESERDTRFARLNDRIWGTGNWIKCTLCPPDATLRPVYHHKDHHDDDRRVATPTLGALLGEGLPG